MRRVLSRLALPILCGVIILGLCAMWAWSNLQRDFADSHAYAIEAVPAITSHWSTAELLDRASPELAKSLDPSQLSSAFVFLSSLGDLTQMGLCTGSTMSTARLNRSNETTAVYQCRATYAEGDAVIDLALVRLDTKWRITSFKVNSPKLLPATPT